MSHAWFVNYRLSSNRSVCRSQAEAVGVVSVRRSLAVCDYIVMAVTITLIACIYGRTITIHSTACRV